TAFFDWDQNGTFETAVPIGSFTTSECVIVVTGQVVVPANALAGTTRMRVIKNYNTSPANPCGTYAFGQVEDYTLNVIIPTCFYPVAQMTGLSGGTATFNWTNNASLTYNWELRQTGSPGTPGAIASGTAVAAGPVSVPGLTIGSQYYFYIQGDCGGGDLSSWGSTSVLLAYCAAGATANSTNLKIKQVTFADVNNLSSGVGGYDDFTSILGNVQAGANYPITIGVSEGYDSDRIRVWIDFNQDFQFSNDELVVVGANPPGNVGPADYLVNATFHMASQALAGTTRMRVRLDNTINGPQNSPCGNSTFGQVEDYTLNVTAAPCLAPTASVSTTPDCANFQFSVSVNVTSLGDGASVTVTDNQGSPAQNGGVGAFNFGPYVNGTQVTYLVSFGPQPLCDTYVSTTYTCTPTNQSCVTAQALTVYPQNACVATNGSTFNASTEPMTGSGCINNVLTLPTVYYSFVATGYANTISLNFPSGSFNASVYTACGGTEIYCSGFNSGNFLLPGLTTGNTYIIRVASTNVGNFTVCVSESSVQPVLNDNCANAQPVTVSAYGACSPTIGNLLGATFSGQANPSCINQTLGTSDVYFSFVANADRHIVTMSQDSTSQVYMMGVYAGCGGTQLLCKLIGPTFDALGTEYLLTGLTVGNTYIVRVLSRPAAAGPFALCVMNPPPATEVDCGGPLVNGAFSGSNNDNQQWGYHSNGTGAFTLTFNSGSVESFTYDKLTVYDGANASAPVLYQNPTGPTINLAGVTVAATGSDLFMTLTSDGSVPPSMNWTVQCSYHP
ncbi:MAG: GEVED domain-containing protein, partial [Flavobacteriales bacterium]